MAVSLHIYEGLREKLNVLAGVRRFKRKLRRFFGSTARNIMRLRHKDDYYKHYYFLKCLCDGIKDVADMEQSSLQVAAVKLMKEGFSSYMREKIRLQIEIDNAAREQHLRLPAMRYARLTRKYARENGLNIKGII